MLQWAGSLMQTDTRHTHHRGNISNGVNTLGNTMVNTEGNAEAYPEVKAAAGGASRPGGGPRWWERHHQFQRDGPWIQTQA
jgi:hypothetical protein